MSRKSPAGEVPLLRTEIGRHGAPEWAHAIVVEATRDYPGQRPPHIDLIPVVSPTIYGGRYFPRINAILVYQTDDLAVNAGTLVHELAHWRSYVDSCGAPRGRSSCGYHGEHDATFYRILAPLYRRFQIDPETRQRVEGSYSYPNSLLR